MDLEQLEAWFRARLGVPVRVELRPARRQVVRVRWVRTSAHAGQTQLELRLHPRLAQADEAQREDLVAWIQHGKRARAASARLDAWIRAGFDEEPGELRALPAHAARGRTHDLLELLGELEQGALREVDYGTRSRPELAWGRRGASRARRSLRLGSYDPRTHVARVHPVLDQDAVPRFFVRYILFHELLHALEPARRDSAGRLRHHHAGFTRRERAYPDYARALAWQERNIGALIRSSRTGKPLVTSTTVSTALRLRGAEAARGTLLGRWVQGWLF